MSTPAQEPAPSASNAPAPAPAQQSSNSSTPVAVGVTVGLLLFFALAALGYFFVYRPYRRRRADVEAQKEAQVGVGKWDVASHVTPFYPFRGEGPRFGHNPGENMRVAHRRADGGWDFTDTGSIRATVMPFTDMGSSSTCPSPTTTVFTTVSTSKKEKLPGELTTRGYIEPEPAPPAYTRTPSTPMTMTPRTSMGDV
ncbi:hypothetical protein EIP91_004882 [Steccherinum ochraceum]|uniref:Uncharacterized protein n=1 Tax=Steccherinum ochraceum TaxID=92696 RepID=A0A4V2MVV2_9APHY|nr:hypothetical protein EIP91_004882 [Steccherinum ochraceum]